MKRAAIAVVVALMALPSAVLAESATRRDPTGRVTGTVERGMTPFSNGNPNSFTLRDRNGKIEETWSCTPMECAVRGRTGEHKGTVARSPGQDDGTGR